MKNHWFEILLLLISLGVILYLGVDWNGPKQKRLFVLQTKNGPKVMSRVKITQIPQRIYDGAANNPEFLGELVGNKKRVLMLTWSGCPYKVAFKNKLEQALARPELRKQYEPHIISQDNRTFSYSCNSKDLYCPIAWVAQNCMGNICIINPKTREAIVDSSHNASQILPLLTAYAQWNTESLFAEK